MVKKFSYKRKRKSVEDYVNGVLSGNRVVLSQAITMVESTRAQDHLVAQEILRRCLPEHSKSIRIGITGSPGVGKSTFIDVFGTFLTKRGHKVAVLAVDPSSQVTKGSIMGDKTRMAHLSLDPNAFIRPSPTGASLGGVTRKTRETMILCEASGFDVILVETVGVGQSETAVHSMVDYFLLLILANSGDELQGIKRGIVEMADAIAITKADGENQTQAEVARLGYKSVIHFFQHRSVHWQPPVSSCSAFKGEGIEEIWQNIQKFQEIMKKQGLFEKNRQEQGSEWMREVIWQKLEDNFFQNKVIAGQLRILEKEVKAGKTPPLTAANNLFEAYCNTVLGEKND